MNRQQDYSTDVLLKSLVEKKSSATISPKKANEVDMSEPTFLENMNKALDLFSKRQTPKSEYSIKNREESLQTIHDEFLSFSNKLSKLADEKQRLEEKLKLFTEKLTEQNGNQQQEKPLQLQEVIKRCDQFVEHLIRLEDNNNDILIYNLYPFIKPYLESNPTMSVEDILEKISHREKKKLVNEIWESHQEELKKIVSEKYKFILENSHLIYSINQLNESDFNKFSRHLVEHDIITRFINDNERLLKFKEIIHGNNSHENTNSNESEGN